LVDVLVEAERVVVRVVLVDDQVLNGDDRAIRRVEREVDVEKLVEEQEVLERVRCYVTNNDTRLPIS
jgi:hypothetical protein